MPRENHACTARAYTHVELACRTISASDDALWPVTFPPLPSRGSPPVLSRATWLHPPVNSIQYIRVSFGGKKLSTYRVAVFAVCARRTFVLPLRPRLVHLIFNAAYKRGCLILRLTLRVYCKDPVAWWSYLRMNPWIEFAEAKERERARHLPDLSLTFEFHRDRNRTITRERLPFPFLSPICNAHRYPTLRLVSRWWDRAPSNRRSWQVWRVFLIHVTCLRARKNTFCRFNR